METSIAKFFIVRKIIKTFTLVYTLKGIVYPKLKTVLLLTHSQVVPNLYEFLSSVKHKRR